MSAVRISLFAPNGRMGKAIVAAVAETPGFLIDQDDGDVLVDFSAPSALGNSLDRATSAGIPILVGTTWSSGRQERWGRTGTSKSWRCTTG